MERVIYSPSIDFLPEAEELAKDTMLPILIGESEATKEIKFERGKVQVLKIPKVYFFGLNLSDINIGFHQSAMLVDEFICGPISDYELVFDNEVQIPVYIEKHKVKWSFPCSTSGTKTVYLFLKDKKTEEVEFNVH